MLTTHRLSRPFDRVETFLSPRVLRLHLWMALAKLACGLDSGKKSLNHHLYRLAMERELSLRGFLQGIMSGPGETRHACLFVGLATQVPYSCCFHLSGFQALELLVRQVIQLVDFYRLHV